jgi:FMN phosphatase YigB (HAD superfamily)
MLVAVQAAVFDIGGVLERPTNTNLDDRWERRLGLKPGEFFARLRRSGLGRAANLGRISETEFDHALGELYGLDQPMTGELLKDLWDWYVGELNAEMVDYFRRLRPRYRTAILSNAAAGGRREEQARYGFDAMADDVVYSFEVGIEKPDQRIDLLTCERLGVHPGDGVMVDDVEANVVRRGRSGCARCCSRARPRRSRTWRRAWRTRQAEPTLRSRHHRTWQPGQA